MDKFLIFVIVLTLIGCKTKNKQYTVGELYETDSLIYRCVGDTCFNGRNFYLFEVARCSDYDFYVETIYDSTKELEQYNRQIHNSPNRNDDINSEMQKYQYEIAIKVSQKELKKHLETCKCCILLHNEYCETPIEYGNSMKPVFIPK